MYVRFTKLKRTLHYVFQNSKLNTTTL